MSRSDSRSVSVTASVFTRIIGFFFTVFAILTVLAIVLYAAPGQTFLVSRFGINSYKLQGFTESVFSVIAGSVFTLLLGALIVVINLSDRGKGFQVLGICLLLAGLISMGLLLFPELPSLTVFPAGGTCLFAGAVFLLLFAFFTKAPSGRKAAA